MKKLVSVLRSTSVGAALLATICAACVPAYAAVFSSLGVGFLNRTAVMRPLVAVLLGLGFVVLLLDGRRHRAWWPVVVAFVGSLLIWFFRYYYFKTEWVTFGVGLLVFATTANYYRRKYAGVSPVCSID